jgi:hypothetical protein
LNWLTKILSVIRWLVDLVLGNPGQEAALNNLVITRNELKRERIVTALLRQRLAAKEARIRELEASLAERDPGALLDSVFSGKPADPAS